MKQPSYSNFRIILGSVLITLVIVAGFWIAKQTIAYTGPTGIPGGSTTGAFRFDAAGNAISVGGSIPDPSATLLVSGATAQSTNYGLVVENADSNPALQVRDDGKVFVGGFTSINPATLQSQSIYSNFADYDTLTTNQGNVYNFIDGQGTADILDFATIQGVILGNIGADYITSDVFGSQDAPGNYAFPAKLGVGTTTVLSSGLPEALTVQGGAYLTGYLGIGKVPTVALDIAGLSTSTGRINFRSGLAETTYGEIYGDANGVTISSRNATANYGLHFNLESEQMRITTTGVGIGVFPPTSKLDVAGTIKSTGLDTTGNTKTTAFQLTTNPINGYILTSDALGNGTWQSAADLLPSGSQHQTLRHSGFGWVASSFLINTDTGVGINTTPIAGTYLEVGSGGYLQFDKFFNGAPLAADCDNNLERGRLTLDYVNLRFYVCTGATGWKFFKLQ